jgi:murein DD-endopeptidase MepM/ murein hydrolase activator NlpD
MRFRKPDGPRAPLPDGGRSPSPGRRHRSLLRRLLAVALAVPMLTGGLFSPGILVRADQLSDAVAQQRALQKEISAQKAKIAQLASLQVSLSSKIASTRTSLAGVNADLATMRTRVGEMVAAIAGVQATYDELVAELKSLDGQLVQVQAEEALKTEQLTERKAQLAERIRNAYDVDRTSLLEIVLSSDSFTDFLAEASYYMDIADQDRALAQQISADQQVLAELHATVVYTHEQTEILRTQTAAPKQDLDGQLVDLQAAQVQLQALEAETQRLLNEQKAAYASLTANKTDTEKALAEDAAAEKALQSKINELVAAQARLGRIPSVYNGTLDWPMAGTITQEYGCTGFSWEPPLGGCSHFHRGIDIAAPMYTPIRASGPGTVVFAGANPYDPYPKAWIVIIAHSTGLRTWYAHIDNSAHPPAVRAGDVVRAGQVIAYEGMTGRTTGPHLHWAVELEDDFVNPRLFL